MKNKVKIIKCPKCGYEYLPAEIFYPDTLLGHPKDIIRTLDGKIDFYNDTAGEFEEEYICDNCDTTFTVTASINFDTAINVNHDFSSDYSSTIYKDRIILEETNLFDEEE